MISEVMGLPINYESLGEGRPIIMVHGWSRSSRQMLGIMEPIFKPRRGWRRIYPDLPGHGGTPGRDWITDQDKMLEVLLGFIDENIPGQRFVLAGESSGAYLARGVVYHKAAQLDGLLLTVPLIVAPDAERKLPAHTTLVRNPELAAELPPDEAESFNALAVVQSRRVVDLIKASAPTAEDMGDPKFQAGIREDPKRYSFSFDVDALAAPFAAPALIVAGRQDAVVGYRQAWEILEKYPRGTFAVLDRAGHLLEFEQQELFNVLVSEWLDRVEEYAAASP